VTRCGRYLAWFPHRHPCLEALSFQLNSKGGSWGHHHGRGVEQFRLKLLLKVKATTPPAIGIQVRSAFLLELIMDEEEHHKARSHHLRQLARSWLETLRDSATGPYAGRAFPESFPFSETPLHASFAWKEFYNGERWLDYPVELKFTMHPPDTRTPPPPPLTRYTWLVTSRTHPVYSFWIIELTVSDSN
jgi:hypothetical protein